MKLINNLKIGLRLILFFSIIVIITGIGLAFMTLKTKDITKQVDLIYNVHLLSMEYLIEADRDAYQSSLAISHALFQNSLSSPDRLNELLNDAQENYNQISERYTKFENLSTVTTETDNVEKNKIFHDSHKQLGFLMNTIIDLINSGDIKKADELYFSEYSKTFGAMRNTMDAFTEISLNSAKDAHSISLRIGKIILLNSFIIGAIIILVIIVSSLILTQSINKPIAQVVENLSQIAKGNLKINIANENINRKDEVGILMDRMHNMAAKLLDIVSTAKESSIIISDAGNELNKTSQELSQGANEQASSVEEVSSTMEEISSNIQQNSENAKQTGQISLSAQEGIREVVSLTEEAFDAQRKISERIQIINEIAFQTNLLALNAAVEAARAGEHGKGFAVVASEVRKLAERSKVAADEIIILASKSLESAERAGNHMSSTLPEVEKTTNLVQEITASSLEQTNGVEQVNSAIQQLNDVSQRNAAASEQIATSSEEISNRSNTLKEIMSFFKTED